MGQAVARRQKTNAARLSEAQLALELHLAGISTVEICDRLRISRATLERRIKWAMSVRIDPAVAEYRAQATARLAMLRKRAFDELTRRAPITAYTIDGDEVVVPAIGPAEVASILGRLVQIEEQEAKLRGAYAPTQVDVTVRDGLFADLDAAIANLASAPREEVS